MKKYCTNCGKEISENQNVCLNCGVIINREKKVKIPGNGLSIAGMVLGIIAATWSLFELLGVYSIRPALSEMASIEQYISLSFIYFWFAFGYTLFSLIPSIIGLPLSIAGCVKKRTGKNICGIILNVVGLLVSIAMYVYIMCFI